MSGESDTCSYIYQTRWIPNSIPWSKYPFAGPEYDGEFIRSKWRGMSQIERQYYRLGLSGSRVLRIVVKNILSIRTNHLSNPVICSFN